MFGLGDLRLIQLDVTLKCVQSTIALEQLKLLDELLGNLGNLEEVRFNIEAYEWARTLFIVRQISGVGQLIAENLPQARQNCHLKVFNVDGGQLVCWRHLFNKEEKVTDRYDYRELGRELLTYMAKLQNASGSPMALWSLGAKSAAACVEIEDE